MKPSPTMPQAVAIIAMILALCCFVVVIAHGWAAHALPSNNKVLFLSFGGMTVVGAVAGFVVSALANGALRAGPPALRVPFTVLIWAAFCIALTACLLQTGTDQNRLVPLIAIVAFWGLLVGPYHAELFVGVWFYKRRLKVIEAERDRKLVEIERDRARKLLELQRRFKADRDARLNEQERPNAIRNYIRS
jgi:hypothetical protein